MTEDEWLKQAGAFAAMFGHLLKSGAASNRQLRLLAVACCGRVWNLLPDDRSRRAVEVAEAFADGLVSEKEMAKACSAASAAGEAVVPFGGQAWDAARAGSYHAARAATWATDVSAADAAWSASTEATKAVRGAGRACQQGEEDFVGPERDRQAALLRDIFGPLPFRPEVIEPAVLTRNDGAVVKMAKAMYEQRRFGDMPQLADALEEAGCTNADILAHCREQGAVHVRGCWVLDVLMSKE